MQDTNESIPDTTMTKTSTTTPTTAQTAPDAPQRVAAKPTFGTGGFGHPPNRSRVDDEMRDEHRDAYAALLRRGTSVPKLRAWLGERGYDFGRAAVANHKAKWTRGFNFVREGSEIGAHFAKFARAAGLSMSEATLGGMQQMLMQFFTRQQADDAAPLVPKEIQVLGSAVSDFVDTQRKFEQACREHEESKRKAAEAGEAAAKKGASGKDVVLRMREILGV
jgi:hypothetical protein